MKVKILVIAAFASEWSDSHNTAKCSWLS